MIIHNGHPCVALDPMVRLDEAVWERSAYVSASHGKRAHIR